MNDMNMRVGIIQINVTDLDVAWDFFVGRLGLQGHRTLGPGRPFELKFGVEGPIVLVYPAQREIPHDYPQSTGVVLVFYTDDIRQTIAQWTAKNVEFIPIAWAKDETGVAYSPFGQFIAFRDPFGNVYELLEPN